jgi:hypothetical protein
MTEYYKILRIEDAIDNISNGQIAVESSANSIIGQRAWGGKDWHGNVTRFLALNKPGQLETLNLSGPTTILDSGILVHDSDGNVTGGKLTIEEFNGYLSDGPIGVYTEGDGIDITDFEVSLDHLGLEDLSAPGADRIFFWDHSALASKWLSLGGNLSITGTVLNSSDTNTTYTASNGVQLTGNNFTNTGVLSVVAGEATPAAGAITFAGSGVSQEGSIFTFSSGSGTLQDAYNFGGPGLGRIANILSGQIYFNNANRTNEEVDDYPVLFLGQSYAGAVDPWFTVINQSTAGAPSMFFSGATGEGSTAYDLGHKIWTEGNISIGRMNAAGHTAFFSATTYPTNPDTRPAIAQMYAYALGDEDPGDPAVGSEAYIRVIARAASGGTSSAFIDMYSRGIVSISSSDEYVDFLSTPIVGAESISFGEYAETDTWNASFVSVDFSQGKNTRVITQTANASTITITRPRGGCVCCLKIIASGADRSIANIVDAGTSANFIGWLEGVGNPDDGAITIPMGSFVDVSIRYEDTPTTGAPTATGIVVGQ